MLRAAAILALAAALAAADDPSAIFREAAAKRASGDLPGALDGFREAAKLDPRLPGVHREIGLILLEQRDFSDAAAEFLRAVEANASDYPSQYDLALALSNAGDGPAAIKEARRLVRLQPRAATSFYALGHVYAAASRREDAILALRTAAGLDATLFRAWFELGKLLEDAGDRNGAVDAYQSAVKAAPSSPAPRYRLGRLLQRSGKADEASRQLAAARDIQERRARAEQAAGAYRDAERLLEKAEYGSAIEALERAASLRPDFPEIGGALAEAHERWGLRQEQVGDMAGAIEHYRAALAAEPSAATHNHLGVLLAKSGQLDAAIASFQAALSLDPGFKNAEANLRQALSIRGGR